MAAFSVFFTQSPSFLEHQRLMKEIKGKENAKSLFNLSNIPCDNQIRNLLDPIPASKVWGTFAQVYKWLQKQEILNRYQYLEDSILVILDGTEYFSSKKINCPYCRQRKHRNGEITYHHQVITPVIVSPNKKEVINLEPEFIKKQDGKSKQDCENAAVKRWLLRNPIDKGQRITLLGDDLYARQPICELSLNQGYDFIFVALPSSHKALYEWLDYLTKNGEVLQWELDRYQRGRKLSYRYRYVNGVPLRETEPSLMVNWFEVEIFDPKKKKVIYHNSWITNHHLNAQNIPQMVSSGRCRWKIENEGNNLLKNQGYHFEHNFGHGQENLSEILLSLNLLSFLFHNVLDLVNAFYREIRLSLGTRKTFFNDIRALLKYFYFENWSDFFSFILTRNDEPSHIDSS
jgi:hypothetical protein